MAHIVITSGPTRQYLDPVRYLTNSSSGKMGACLADSALRLGHQVTVISGPVQVDYPPDATVIDVVSTQEMLEATQSAFAMADGLIGAAAPCDYMPIEIAPQKLSKTGQGLQLSLRETPDIVATLGALKRVDQWVVGFALETEDVRFRAIVKMAKKRCDMIVSNSAEAMNSPDNAVEIIKRDGEIVEQVAGPKGLVADRILYQIQKHLLDSNR
ncbi:phosphopantothenoylcysteine decarboxylase [Pirellulaceae bacterium SH467]|jgi:phosphopantothenoylcysteine decarboxylase/phosphopantothenate--cysteine ligase